jgi:hypothetical protein
VYVSVKLDVIDLSTHGHLVPKHRDAKRKAEQQVEEIKRGMIVPLHLSSHEQHSV